MPGLFHNFPRNLLITPRNSNHNAQEIQSRLLGNLQEISEISERYSTICRTPCARPVTPHHNCSQCITHWTPNKTMFDTKYSTVLYVGLAPNYVTNLFLFCLSLLLLWLFVMITEWPQMTDTDCGWLARTHITSHVALGSNNLLGL